MRAVRRTLKPFLAGAAVALAGQRLLSAPRKIAPPAPDPFGVETGRGEPDTPPSQQALAKGYETADASAPALPIALAIFAGSVGACIAGTVLALGAQAPTATLTALQRHHVIPPEPRLQSDPVADLARYRMDESTKLTGYAKLEADIGRIPIGRAMAIRVGKGLDAP